MSEATFFTKLNYAAYPGLRAVKTAVDKGDYAAAKVELLNYYRQRTLDGEVKAFDITETDANIGQATLARDFIITGPYEFDTWTDTVRVESNTFAEYIASGDEVTTKVKKEVDNKNISFMLLERQKQAYPIYVESKESSNAPTLVVTLADGAVEEIAADKDTYIHSGNQSTAYGSEDVLEVKEQSDSVSSAFGTQTRRAYINFPLTSLAGKDIEKAELRFSARFADDCTAEYLEFHIISVGDTTWNEASFTWSSTSGVGNTYSWQNSDSGPWWTDPTGCDSEYLNVALRYWYARPMVWEYLRYEADPEGYPEGREYGEKLLVLMNAITQKYDQTTQRAGRTIEFGERNNRWVDVLYNLLPTDVLDPEKNENAAEYFFNIVNYMWGDMNFTRNRSDLGWSNWGAVFLAGMQKAYDFFPEFTDYEGWREYNVSRLTAKFDELYNDDMSFTESGPAYAIWCMELFGDAYRMAELNNRPLGSEYKTMLIYATRFAMECAYPNGYDTNIGDSNYRNRMDKFMTLEKVLGDEHITNYVTGGKDGEAEYLTNYYDSVNSAYMRNSWDPDEAVYINFTNNPSDGHAHPDSNQVLFYAYGQPLLVDSGRYGYSGGVLYNEFRTAQAHNTVEAVGVNMGSHSSSAGKLDYSATNGAFDFASSVQKGYTDTSHTRNVLFLKKGYAIVSDYVTGTASRDYVQNWHFLPSSNASVNGNVISTDFYNKANVTLAPASADSAAVKSGYHSADYGLASVSEFAAFQKTGATVKFDTLLYPTKAGESASVTATDLAPSDSSKGAVQLSGDVNAYYYVKNTDSADGIFGEYTTDAKAAYVEDNMTALVDGTYVKGANISIESEAQLESVSATLADGTLAIEGENLMANSTDEAMDITAAGVSKVTLNGEEIEFAEDNGVIKAVSVAYQTIVTEVGKYVADKDGFVKQDGTNEGAEAKNADFIQAAVSGWAARNAYAAFDLTDAPEFTNAKIKMTVTEPYDGGNIHFYFLDYGDWARSNLPFVLDNTKMPTNTNNAGSYTGYSYHFSGSAAGLALGSEFVVDFTDSLKGYLGSGGSEKFTLAIIAEKGSTDNTSTKFASINHTSYEGPAVVLTNEVTEGVKTETEVVVTFTDERGMKLLPDETLTDVEVGKLYVYSAPETIDAGGVMYTLNETLSSLGVMVKEGENSLAAIYDKAVEVTVEYVCGGEVVDSEIHYAAPNKAYSIAVDDIYQVGEDFYLVDKDYSVLGITPVYDEENKLTVELDSMTILSENLIPNGSFEENLDGWGSVGADDVIQTTVGATRSNEKAYDGTYSMKYTAVASNEGGKSGNNIFGQFALNGGEPVGAGKHYLLRFRRYADSDAITLTVGLKANDTSPQVDESCGGLGNNDKSPVNCNLAGLPTNEWHQLSYILTANEASKYAVVFARWAGNQYFDDFELYEFESDSLPVDVTIKYVDENGAEISSAKTIQAELGTEIDGAEYALATMWRSSGVICEFDAEKTGETKLTVQKGTNEITLVYTDKEYDGVVIDLSFDDEETGFAGGLGKATKSGSITLADGYSGKAASFDGSSFLSLVMQDGGSLLKGMDEITLVYYNKVDSTAINWPFYAAPDTNAQTYQSEHYLGILEKDGNITVERYNNSGSRPATLYSAATTDGKQVAVVVSKDKTELYIDGAKMGEQASAYLLSDILGDSPITQIGKANWGGGEYYSGLIDELAIYARAFTADEIKALTPPEITEVSAVVEGEALKVSVTVENATESSKVVSVGYSTDGTVTGVDEVEEGAAVLPAETKTIKVFVWESLTSLKPLCPAKEKTVE